MQAGQRINKPITTITAATRRSRASGTPLLSVVMPVYNAREFLDESIESILNQTLEDFEFIILDDASNDGSTEALREWAKRDGRIRLFESRRNLGPSGSSNYVVRRARAPLVARMDADDTVLPDRLRRQYEILQSQPDVQLTGTLWEGVDAHGKPIRPRDRWRLVRRSPFSPFAHGSIMFRRETFERVGGYREACAFWEDLDLYLRLAKTGRIVVLTEVFYYYRSHLNVSRLSFPTEEVERALDLMYACVAEFRAGRSYEHLLEASESETRSEIGNGRRPSPNVFYSIGSLRLWSGYSPAILGPLWRSSALSWDAPSAITLLWAAWGELNPSSLRMVLRLLARVRDLEAGRKIKKEKTREWRFE
jgi:glycosyltransferase involved in cell wall biosynthesis